MQDTSEVRLTDRQRFWRERVRACEASGKTIAEFTSEQGYTARSMYTAKKVLKHKRALPGKVVSRFRRAVVQDAAVCGCRVQLSNGVQVEIGGARDGASLRTVLSATAAL